MGKADQGEGESTAHGLFSEILHCSTGAWSGSGRLSQQWGVDTWGLKEALKPQAGPGPGAVLEGRCLATTICSKEQQGLCFPMDQYLCPGCSDH